MDSDWLYTSFISLYMALSLSLSLYLLGLRLLFFRLYHRPWAAGTFYLRTRFVHIMHIPLLVVGTIIGFGLLLCLYYLLFFFWAFLFPWFITSVYSLGPSCLSVLSIYGQRFSWKESCMEHSKYVWGPKRQHRKRMTASIP